MSDPDSALRFFHKHNVGLSISPVLCCTSRRGEHQYRSAAGKGRAVDRAAFRQADLHKPCASFECVCSDGNAVAGVHNSDGCISLKGTVPYDGEPGGQRKGPRGTVNGA